MVIRQDRRFRIQRCWNHPEVGPGRVHQGTEESSQHKEDIGNCHDRISSASVQGQRTNRKVGQNLPIAVPDSPAATGAQSQDQGTQGFCIDIMVDKLHQRRVEQAQGARQRQDQLRDGDGSPIQARGVRLRGESPFQDQHGQEPQKQNGIRLGCRILLGKHEPHDGALDRDRARDSQMRDLQKDARQRSL